MKLAGELFLSSQALEIISDKIFVRRETTSEGWWEEQNGARLVGAMLPVQTAACQNCQRDYGMKRNFKT